MRTAAFCPLAAALLLARGLGAQGTVQIGSVSVSPSVLLGAANPGCSWVTVQVAVARPPNSENPTIVMDLTPVFSSPPGLSVEIRPSWFQATLGDSTTFYATACTPSAGPGRYAIRASIAAVAPGGQYTVLPPSPASDQAEIRVPTPAKGPRVRILSTDFSPAVLNQKSSSGPTCGTATVRVVAESGTGAPEASVSLSPEFDGPPGVEIRKLSPAGGVGQIAQPGTDFTFEVCRMSGATGIAVLRAKVAVPPGSQWTPVLPEDPADALIAVKVVGR